MTENINNCRADELEELLRTKLPENRKFDCFRSQYPTSNDVGHYRALRVIGGARVNTELLPVGIIVGSGGVFSILPDLPVEVVIMVDSNHSLHQWIETQTLILRRSAGQKEYREQVFSSEGLYGKRFGRLGINIALGLERRSFGFKHMLYNYEKDILTKPSERARWYREQRLTYSNKDYDQGREEGKRRFSVCQEAIRRKRVLTATGYLEDHLFMESLGRIIREAEAEITFANFTNVWEVTGKEIIQTVASLPIHEEATILRSSYNPHSMGFYPEIQQPCKGIEEYWRKVMSSKLDFL